MFAVFGVEGVAVFAAAGAGLCGDGFGVDVHGVCGDGFSFDLRC